MQGVQAPRQARSQRTFDNLLDAAEDLLNEKSFLELSINEIVSRAGSSVGSFYARFDDKDALLRCLSERLADFTEREAREFLAEPHTNLATAVHHLN